MMYEETLKKARDWWQHLSTREQWTLIGGAAIAAILLYYAAIWAPLNDSVNSLSKTTQENQALLVWMQQAQKKVDASSKRGTRKRAAIPGSLLTLVDTSIKQQNLGGNVGEIKQINKNNVQIKFDAVAFKDMMRWLTQLQGRYLVAVPKVAMRRTEKPGVIDAELTLAPVK